MGNYKEISWQKPNLTTNMAPHNFVHPPPLVRLAFARSTPLELPWHVSTYSRRQSPTSHAFLTLVPEARPPALRALAQRHIYDQRLRTSPGAGSHFSSRLRQSGVVKPTSASTLPPGLILLVSPGPCARRARPASGRRRSASPAGDSWVHGLLLGFSLLSPLLSLSLSLSLSLLSLTPVWSPPHPAAGPPGRPSPVASRPAALADQPRPGPPANAGPAKPWPARAKPPSPAPVPPGAVMTAGLLPSAAADSHRESAIGRPLPVASG
ncbi:hypothetical protein NL676_016719 [Syzygium grande]|nr:hypothetical protein NL676_016719 [Syzygium grande]